MARVMSVGFLPRSLWTDGCLQSRCIRSSISLVCCVMLPFVKGLRSCRVADQPRRSEGRTCPNPASLGSTPARAIDDAFLTCRLRDWFGVRNSRPPARRSATTNTQPVGARSSGPHTAQPVDAVVSSTRSPIPCEPARRFATAAREPDPRSSRDSTSPSRPTHAHPQARRA